MSSLLQRVRPRPTSPEWVLQSVVALHQGPHARAAC